MKTVGTAILALLAAACAELTVVDNELRQQARAQFGVIEAPAAKMTPELQLGRALFWDERVSLDGKTACASCHPARDWGADRRRFSTDARGALTPRQSPTVFNSLPQPALRWLGDRRSGAEQAEGSLTGSMGFATKAAGLEKLAQLDYLPAFRAAYPQDEKPLNAANYGRAIEAYEATLVTPAPFDRWLAGDDRALSARQMAGLRTFLSTGCAGCHNGTLFGGTTFQKFGLVKEYQLETGSEKVDIGREAMTKKPEDHRVFRVAMLRNVARTAPYFHDGSVDTLDRAVRVMAKVQLGRTLSDDDAAAIVTFLESLTGEVPAHYAPPAGPLPRAGGPS